MTGSMGYGVSPAFLEALETLANTPSWWRDILERDDVFIAVRNGSLNVYHCGASIFRIDDLGGGKLKPVTHAKYLVRNEQALATLTGDNRFEPSNIGWSGYEGPRTLEHMLHAAAALAGEEKRGLHPLIVNSTTVIDVEVSLARPAEPGKVSSGKEKDRMDVVTLQPSADGQAVAVFHEAKHFSNSALRASDQREPTVISQMRRYQEAIKHHQAALIDRLSASCEATVRLAAMRKTVQASDPSPADKVFVELIREVASGKRSLSLDPAPRLIVFGFDADQRDGRWKHEMIRLREIDPSLFPHASSIRAVGNPKASKNFF